MPTHGNPSKWRAGKRLSAKQIVKTFPKHKTYVEPFAGRAYVFFKNDKYEKAILNDLECAVIKEVKKQKCSLKNPAQCNKLKEAKVDCGKDWKKYLKHDSKIRFSILTPPMKTTKPAINTTNTKTYP